MNIYYNKENIKVMIYKILNENCYNQYNTRNQINIKQKWRNEKELRKEKKRKWL